MFVMKTHLFGPDDLHQLESAGLAFDKVAALVNDEGELKADFLDVVMAKDQVNALVEHLLFEDLT